MIALASDHAGIECKNKLKQYLENKGYECKDFGTYTTDSCDYPDFAYKAAKSVMSGECKSGILICGTGIGIGIAANKVRGIRCATCCDEFSTEMTRRHNDANMIAMGARVLDIEKMCKLADIFLNTPFEGGRHANRVAKIHKIEEQED